jgi:flagellar biosynthesis protein FlhG
MAPERIIAVGGGKGGTGKSMIAVNCAIAMADLGVSVTLVDADLGMANQHTMLGIDHVKASLHDFLEHNVEELDDVRMETGVRGLSLIPGSSAHSGDANVKHAQKERLLRAIRKLPTSVVVIDVGAGVHHHTVDLFDVADVRLIVVLNQLVSFQNAYGFLKASILRTIQRSATSQHQRSLFVTAQEGHETERLTSLIAHIKHVDPEFGEAIMRSLSGFQTYFVGNMFTSVGDTDAAHAFARMVIDFLGVRPSLLGWIKSSNFVLRSVVDRVPFLLSGRQDDNALELRRMSLALLLVDVGLLRQGRPASCSDQAGPQSTEDEQAPMGEDLTESMQRFKRRHPRFPVDLAAMIVTANGRIDTRVVELSRSGALLRPGCRLQIGDNILLQVAVRKRNITTRATVRNQRADGTYYGVEFEQEDCIPLPEEQASNSMRDEPDGRAIVTRS